MAKTISFSVITTVLNEAKTIEQLLDSIDRQTILPTEIVIVDAGSKDGTKLKITEWQKAHPRIPVRLLLHKGTNRSVGRNLAIQAASEPYLASIDAGCRAEPEWLAKFEHAFQTDPRVEAVAGFYRVSPENRWEACFAPYLSVMPDQLNSETYLPSSRSLAMTKKVWQRLGGYPEKLNTCEDLVWAARLKEKAVMIVEPKAVVIWQLPVNPTAYFRQVRGYARGDMEAHYRPHQWTIATIYLRYLIFILIPWVFGLYLVYPPVKFFRYTRSLSSLILLPLTQLLTDAGVIVGSLEGYFKFKYKAKAV